jgi:pimeloyl-ACP methyl ester carboxylesterase
MILLMGFGMPQAIAGALFNDIGPDLEMGGLEKILDYVGQGRSFPTWMHAARALEETHGASFPDWGLEDWLAMAKRSLTLSSNGRIVFDYDMKIAEPFKAIDFDNQPDLWPGYRALAGKPVAVVRGALSDLFSEATFQRMGKEVEGADLVTVPRVGHAPLLTEPEAVAAIERLLARAD